MMQRQKLGEQNEPVGHYENGKGSFSLLGGIGRQDYDHTDATVAWCVRPGVLGRSGYQEQGINSRPLGGGGAGPRK